MKKAIIVHGWGGHPQEGWFPWCRTELEKRGYDVSVPEMPNTKIPAIDTWLSTFSDLMRDAPKDILLIGHSIGCQTIIRYLAQSGHNVGTVLLVAPWTTLLPATYEEEGAKEIATPWIETPIVWEKARDAAQRFICVFSDDDPYVAIDEKDIFEDELNALVIIEHKKGHLGGEHDIQELPILLSAVDEEPS